MEIRWCFSSLYWNIKKYWHFIIPCWIEILIFSSNQYLNILNILLKCILNNCWVFFQVKQLNIQHLNFSAFLHWIWCHLRYFHFEKISINYKNVLNSSKCCYVKDLNGINRDLWQWRWKKNQVPMWIIVKGCNTEFHRWEALLYSTVKHFNSTDPLSILG